LSEAREWQPASDEDNGLLTASEVARLNLDADWVIMSQNARSRILSSSCIGDAPGASPEASPPGCRARNQDATANSASLAHKYLLI
jgi:hypothetical protein